jgi:DNA primase catalytic core
MVGSGRDERLMKQRLVNLEAMNEALKPYLAEYLEEHGIKTAVNFKCLDPKHGDTNASMHISKDPPGWAYCHGCNASMTIFHAAHFLEGKPIQGKAYIEENVLYLAKKFGVQVELEDLTPEEIYEYRTYSAYDLASKLISDPSFGDYSMADKEIARRGWEKSKIEGWGIGTVNYQEFKSRMKAAGFEPGFLGGIDLDRSNLFDKHNLLFTIYDDQGRPVGFSAKNLKHKKEDSSSGPKYINTRGTGLECAIFKKGERLYGFDIAKDSASPLYIFEGQADVITARHHGLMNCCCTLGTALTDHHINLLKKTGIFNIVLVFDSDEAGEAAVQKAVDDKFSKEKDFRIKLIQLPKGEDPDELLRRKGIDEFVRLKKWTAFEWRLSKFMEEQTENEDLDDEKRSEIAQKMSQIIVSEKSHIRQAEMAKQVARMTGHDFTTIMSEVKRLRSEKEAEVQDRKKAVIEALQWEVQKNPDEAEMALIQAQHQLNDINKSVQLDDENNSVLKMVLTQKETDEQKSEDFAGFFMKPHGLGSIAARMDDDWKSDTLIFVGGSEQAGKTTFVSQMAYEIASDDRNNAICIYHSIDDASRMILYKMVCCATEDTKLRLNHVSSPKYWTKQEGHEFVPDLREQGYRKIIQMIKDEKIVIRDASDGQSLMYAESLVKRYREKYPDKKIVLFCDNFHKYPDLSELQGHERVKRLSNLMKNMTVANHITIVSTVEYRKLAPGERPTNLAIAESRALAYDASAIIHLHNDLHHNDEDTAVLIHYDNDGNILPRIWVKFGKNKISGFEGREFLDLYGYAGQYRAVDLEVAKKEQAERLEFLRENNAGDTY